MPNKVFIEKYPLYKKYRTVELRPYADDLKKVNINMYCSVCKSNQTYVMKNEYWENLEDKGVQVNGRIFRLVYKCVHCNVDIKHFNVKIDVKLSDEEASYILTKIGQDPPWEIETNKDIEILLGENKDYYQKGLICESQSYGIGAYAYYRRIVEEIIDKLLEEISDLMHGEEKEKYMEALGKVKKTTVAKDKINLVKELLPGILRPNGVNPLNTLYDILSEGLHEKNDEECINYAMTIREVLLFLVQQVATTSNASKKFTSSMKVLLEKKSRDGKK